MIIDFGIGRVVELFVDHSNIEQGSGVVWFIIEGLCEMFESFIEISLMLIVEYTQIKVGFKIFRINLMFYEHLRLQL